MSDETDVRIVRVELIQQSRQAWRELNRGHPDRYPVLLWLSRSLDDFERYALTLSTAGRFTLGEDPMTVLIESTTLEDVRAQLHALNAEIVGAASAGRELRERAWAEDDRLFALEAEINDELGNPNN